MKSQKQSSNILTRKWHQLWCLHLWKRGDIVDLQYGKGFLYNWDCQVCGKTIRRFDYESPISGILPEDPWLIYKKDPLHTVSPPIIRSDD